MNNRHVALYMIICVACLLIGCGQHRYPASLVTADSLAEADADRAQLFLDSIAAETKGMAKSDLMYYKLLRLKVEGKKHKKRASDKAALEVLNYYENDGNRQLLPVVYFYVASTYRDLNDAPMALEYYQKANDLFSDDDNTKLHGYTYNQIGRIFLMQGINSKAYENYYRSFQYDSLRKDTFDMVYSLIDMSMTYEDVDVAKSLIYVREAMRLNKEAKLGIGYTTDSRLSVVYSNQQMYDSAYIYIQEPLRNLQNMDSSTVFSIARDIYFYRGQLDSAKFFCNELLRMGSVYAKMNAAKIMTHICSDEKEFNLGLKYMDLYNTYADSVSIIDAKQALANANSLYNYSLREKQIAQIKATRTNVIIAFLLFVIIALVTVSILAYYNFRSRQRQQKLRLRIGILNRIEKEHREQSESEINAKRKEIDDLTEKLRHTNENRATLEQLLEEQKAKLDAAIEAKKWHDIRRNEEKTLLLQSKAYATAKKKLNAHKPLSTYDWKDFTEEIDNLLPDFRLLLFQTYNLSEQEFHISLLVKMGFKNAETCILVSREESTVSQTRKRLYTKITGKNGSAADFDKFIMSL